MKNLIALGFALLMSMVQAQVFKCEVFGKTAYQDFPCETLVAQKPSGAASSVADLDTQLAANALAEKYDLAVDDCKALCYRAPQPDRRIYRTFRHRPLYTRRY